MSYSHISRRQRQELALLLRMQKNQTEIAQLIGVHKSTVSRELKRNRAQTATGYSVQRAEKLTCQRHATANQRFRKLGTDPALTALVESKLKLYWAPEQVAGRLKGEYGRAVTSHPAVYRWVYAHPGLHQYLRFKMSKYRRTRAAKARLQKRAALSPKRDIATRPQGAKWRTRLGHWEGDTVMGTDRKARILTHVDRRSGYLLASLVESGEAAPTRAGAEAQFARIPAYKKHTLTLDNGFEHAEWELTEKNTGLTVYFAKPYHSWERGTNENANGLLRQFFPKGSSFATLKPKQLSKATAMLNHRPGRRYGYLTPHEVFHGVAL